MIKKIKEIWGIKTLRNKIIFTLLMLAFIRLGCVIPTPGVKPEAIGSMFENMGAGAGMLNAITGGALQSMALFALGIVPYINASIIMQLLTIAVPAIEKMAKEDDGRKKMNKITRAFGIALAALQAFGITFAFRNENILVDQSILTYLTAIVALTAGTAILVWIGDRITEKGLGNGTSLIIFVNILSSMPGTAVALWQTKGKTNPVQLLIIIAAIVAIIALVVYEQSAERRIPVEYAKKAVGRKYGTGGSSFIPLKLNISGVMPIIFAMSITTFPAMIVKTFNVGGVLADIANALELTTVSGGLIFVFLVFFFAYFYSSIQFNPLEFSENLKKSGGVVTGIRPGGPTAEYIRKILSKTTFIGASFLAVIAMVPPLVEYIFNVQLAVAGTSLLIAVGVAVEIIKQIDAHMISRSYQGFLK